MSDIDTILMGRNTWEFCEGLDTWPYPEKECFLVSDTRSDATKLESVDWNRNVWIVGGPNVVSSALSYSYVAKAVLTVHPIWLGSSPKLVFGGDEIPFQIENVQFYPDENLVQLHMIPKSN